MAVKTFVDAVSLPASDINTYLANSGLVYVTSQTVGTGVSSVTVTGAFNSAYDNYRIIYSGGVGSTTQDLRIQLGSATTNYYSFLFYGNYASNAVNGLGSNNTTAFLYTGGTDGSFTMLNVDLFNPFNALPTTISSVGNLSAGNFGVFSGRHAANTSFTAFTLTPNGGTLTGGTITVYGYRKA